MNRFFTLLLAASCLTAVGQTEYPYPYNPDGNNDGYISLNDLLDLLSVYGSEFNAGVLATDSLSAIFYTGEMDYWDCASSCVGLKGNWKVLDHHLIGSYREVLSETEDYCWLDHTQFNSLAVSATFPVLYPSSASVSVLYPNDASVRCFCQTRTRADIEDINVCEGLEDECGVCNGDGAIYECGCSDIPEGDCDCEGNQLDAIGVCGGDCLEDADGDGVCDPILGPCEGQNYVTYHGYDYEIVETADGRCWFAENLRTKSFANDVAISEVPMNCSAFACWSDFRGMSGTSVNATAGLMEVGSGSTSYIPLGFTSSVLYNFYAVVDGQGLCPSGWHVPNVEEFNTLVFHYGGEFSAALSLRANELDGCIAFTTNPSGLEIDARLDIAATNINFTQSCCQSRLWTSEYHNPNNRLLPIYAQFFSLSNCGATSEISIGYTDLNRGFSVRCIKDAE